MKQRTATTTHGSTKRSAFGLIALGLMAAVLAVPSAALAAGGSGDIAGFTDSVADAGGKNKNKGANKGRKNNNRANRGANRNSNRSNRSANRGSGRNNNRNANRGNNRSNNSNKKAKRNNNNRSGNNGARSNRSTRPNNRSGPSTPNMFKNSQKNHPHYQAMGKDHDNYKQIKKGSRGYNHDRGRDRHNGHSNRKNRKHRNDHHYDDYSHGYDHGNHGHHGHNHKKKVVKKKVVNKYYGYGGHGHHSHYGHGYYSPRVGFSVHIGSGVYAGYNSHYDSYSHDPYYDNDTYCRTTTYTRYGNHGTSTYRRTTCSTDAYGGYSHTPVRVNKTYNYYGTDYNGYRDYQESTRANNSYSTGTYTNPTAQYADYTEVSPATPSTPVEPALERVGMVGPWGDLVNSKAAEAQDIFDQIAKDYPEDGLPQLGFAVASAQRGQYTTAAAGIERALEVDSASVDRMPESVALRDEIRGLADELRRSNGDGMTRSQYWVTVAAFDYMGGDPYRARASLDQAVQNGASDLVVRGLRDRIER